MTSNLKAPFYITTPIYYVNDAPHIGHAYTTIACDVMARFMRLDGHETFFLTGTDEHGQKVQNAAAKRNKDPQEHCDEMVLNFQNIWKELGIDFDIFYRTTDENHKKIVQRCLQKLFGQELIYDQSYEGWYCESEEIFYTEKELVDGRTPQGNTVEKVTERNYFFKMSKYQDALRAHIENNPEFIQPESKKNEVLGFLKKPLQDLCISRPKKRLSWGIELPFDSEFVTYVWFDALLNYAVAVGLEQEERSEEFQKWWCAPGGVTHLIGKDILTTHCVYWTTMLMALEAPLPKMVFAHGWWLTQENEKMSKSKGSVVRPLDMKEIVGIEGLRYFLVRDIRFGNDAQFSQDLVISRVNTDLANNLGNLLNRVSNLVVKYFDGATPEATDLQKEDVAIEQSLTTLSEKVRKHIDLMSPSQAVDEIIQFLTQVNQYVDEQAPWKQAKENLSRAGTTLRVVLESLTCAGALLHPVMPEKMDALFERIGSQNPSSFEEISHWMKLQTGALVQKGDPLFPRIDLKKEA